MARSRELLAFEEYYTLTKTGIKPTDAITQVAEKFDVGKRTVYRWKKDYNWDKLATERSIRANEELADDIKEQSDMVVKDFRKPFIKILNRLVARCVHENEVKINSVKDLVTVIETVNKLQRELDIGRAEIVSAEYNRTKHVKEINSLLYELKERNEHDLMKEQDQESMRREHESRLHQTEVYEDG